MEKISRKDAQRAGLKRFYTGKPCMYGHDSFRYTSNGACCNCADIYNAPPLGFDEVLRFSVRISMFVPPEMRQALKKYLIDVCTPAFFTSHGLGRNGAPLDKSESEG